VTDLSTCSDAELKAEVRRRDAAINAVISQDPYHPRRWVCSVVSRLMADKVYPKTRAKTIAGAKVWLEYRHYLNAAGGEVRGVMVEVDGVAYRKDLTEAIYLDVEMIDWINYIRKQNDDT
jgi:hypothetical protein